MSSADVGRFARFYRPSMLTRDPWAGLKDIRVKTVPVSGGRTTDKCSSQPRLTTTRFAGNSNASDFVAAGLHASIRSQIEYYFTVRNLERDQYLRSLMDRDGWVPVAALLQFNKLKALTTDQAAVREALDGSRQLQVSEDATHVRSKNRPRKWVLPEAQRS
jgi:La domain